MKPYYEHGGITIYHGDCRDVFANLYEQSDLVLTDPPYGISMANGMGGGGFDSTGKYARNPSRYEGKWDDAIPSRETLIFVLQSGKEGIIWGGNYLSHILPKGNKWLVWDKEQVMPSYSDAEIAFTTLPGDSVRMFRYGVNRHRAEEYREHPTQKPVPLMQWCIGLAGSIRTVIDPFSGAGSSLVAAKNLGLTGIGIEIEERYCEIAANRLAQEVLAL